MRHGLRLALAGLLFLGLAAPLAAEATPEAPLADAAAKASGLREGTWHGYRRVSFTLEGHAAWVTFPKTPAPGKPWVWRARFPGYHDEIDLALLKRGFHTAHIDTANLYGSPRAMRLWDAFYALVTRLYGLNPRVSLYGCSRGGLFIYAFADRWPERVASIYGDTPVMDFTTWPEGKDGRGERSEADWTRLKQVYGFKSDAEAEAWRGTGLHLAEKLARAHLPIWHTIGPEDAVVPPRHNTEPFAERFRAAGGEMAIHVNKGPYSLRGHHFPLDAVDATADFIEAHAPLPDLSPEVMAAWSSDAAALRPALDRIRRQGRARVVFLGGSITQNPGWQNLVAESLRRRFPGTDFTFDNVGVASLGSLSHAFRWRSQAGGPIDLLFFEAAVNDLHNGQRPEETERAYEGVLRGVLQANPEAGIVCLHFAEPRHTADYRAGREPAVVARQARVAAHYGVAQVNLAREVADRLAAGQFDWARDFRDLHPSPFGQRLYYNAIRRLLDAASDAPAAAPRPLPAPLRADCWAGGDLLPPAKARDLRQARVDPAWRPDPPAETRRLFVGCPLLCAEGEGAAWAFDFEGRTVGALLVCGPDSAPLEWSLDGGPWTRLETRTPWSGHIHMPWPYVLADGLAPGAHAIRFRVRAEGGRDAVRLHGLMVSP